MKTTFTLFCIVLTLCLNMKTVNAQVNLQDSLALVDFYNSTDGPHWINNSNWLTTKPVKTWYGIYVDHKRVLDIILNDNRLKGTIPHSIGNLTQLVQFYVYNNLLTGPIPASLGNTNLADIIATNNHLTGSIPSSIGKLTNCYDFELANNQLSGNLPSSMANMTGLMYVDLHNNQFTGGIPELGTSEELLYLNLSHNMFTGKIPSTLNFTSYINLSHNQLTGNIPSYLYDGTDVAYLYLNNNQLSGKIPAGIGNFLIIRHLFLNNNHFTGEIPSSVGKLTSLNTLNLSNNNLSGDIPSSIGNVGSDAAKPVKIYLSGNNLSGTVPNTIANLPTGSELNLSYNAFTFDGMELIAQKFPDSKYDPQSLIPVHQNGTSLSVSAGGTLSNNTYTWFRDNVIVATNTGDPAFHPTQSGVYRAKVTNSIATQLKLHSELVHYEVPAITSVDNTSQQYDKSNSFRVYPNPAKDIIHVEINANTTFSLIDQAGKVLLTANINSKSNINVSSIAEGLYYLRNNNTGAVKKVVITR
jgi:Leucine-rich repeat (LRR) protein